MDKNISRLAAQGYVAFQKARTGFTNQIRDILYHLNEGISFDLVQEKKEKNGKFNRKYADKNLSKILVDLLLEGKIDKLTAIFLRQCLETVSGGTIEKEFTCPNCKEKSRYEDDYDGIKAIEKQYVKLMKKAIKDEPIYQEFLNKIRGLGTVHSSMLMYMFGNCEKFDTISKLHKYCGYDVGIDNKPPRREKGKQIKFSPKKRSRIWLISDNLMKQNKGIYRKTYDTEKARQLGLNFDKGFLKKTYNGYEEDDTKLSKGHAHNRALRKMVKLFLSHFWEASRELAGLPTEKTYVEGVLKHEHIIYWKEALKLEGKYEPITISKKSSNDKWPITM